MIPFVNFILHNRCRAYNGKLQWAIIPLLGKRMQSRRNLLLMPGPQTRHWHWHLLCTWERCCADSLHFAYENELIACPVVLQLKVEDNKGKKVTLIISYFQLRPFYGMMYSFYGLASSFLIPLRESNPDHSATLLPIFNSKEMMRWKWCRIQTLGRVIKTSLLFLIIRLNVCRIAALLFNGP